MCIRDRFVQFRCIYIPVGAVAGILYLHGVSAVKLSDLIAVIVCLGGTKCKISFAYTDGLGYYRRSAAACAYEIVAVYVAGFVKLRRIYIPVGTVA